MNRTLLDDIASERDRQDEKWGDQRSRTLHHYFTILGEEVGEVANAVLERDYRGLREELIQVAAVAMGMIEALDYQLGDKGFPVPLTPEGRKHEERMERGINSNDNQSPPPSSS